MNQQTHLRLLSSIPLFQDLSLEEIESLNDYLTEIELAADEIVFEENDPGEFVCFVVDGRLDVIKQSLTGGPEAIAQVSKGRSIGEMALVDNLSRSATVRAATDTTLTVLSRSEFERLLAEYPHMGIKILRYLARAMSLNLRRTSNLLSDSLEPV